MSFSADASNLAFWSDEDHESLQIWNRDSDGPIRQLPLNSLANIRLSPDGRRLAWGIRGGLVLHDLETADEVELTTGDDRWHLPIQFSLDGTALISTSEDHTYDWWNLATRARVTVPFIGLAGMTLSPQGDTIVIYRNSQSAIWRVSDATVRPIPNISLNPLPSPYLLAAALLVAALILLVTRKRGLKVEPRNESELLTAELVERPSVRHLDS